MHDIGNGEANLVLPCCHFIVPRSPGAGYMRMHDRSSVRAPFSLSFLSACVDVLGLPHRICRRRAAVQKSPAKSSLGLSWGARRNHGFCLPAGSYCRGFVGSRIRSAHRNVTLGRVLQQRYGYGVLKAEAEREACQHA